MALSHSEEYNHAYDIVKGNNVISFKTRNNKQLVLETYYREACALGQGGPFARNAARYAITTSDKWHRVPNA